MSLPAHPSIIRRSEVDAIQDATAILATARLRAAAERVDERQKGFKEGYEQGMKAAAEALLNIEDAMNGYWSTRDAELIEVALAISHQVIAQLPPDDALRGLVQKALREHRHDTRLIVRASPECHAALNAAFRDRPEFQHVEISLDPSLSASSLLLDHSQGQTEIGLLGQFRTMLLQATSP